MKDALIYVDAREKKPLVFPEHIRLWTPGGREITVALHTETKTLDTADYVLASHPRVGGVERKNGAQELYDNLFTDDAVRFSACLKRISEEFSAPAMYLECTLREVQRPLWLTRPTRRAFDENRILDALLRELAKAKMVLLTGVGATTRGKTAGGELVARYLIQAALAQE